MQLPAEDRLRNARQTLEAINEFIRKGEYGRIIPAVTHCPYPHELAHVYDKDGQGIFFKLALPD